MKDIHAENWKTWLKDIKEETKEINEKTSYVH